MLDKQINLFKIDTNAFLTSEENEHRARLVKLKKVRDHIYKMIDNRGKNATPQKVYKKLKAKQDSLVKSREIIFVWLIEEIAREEKKWKEYILKSAADNVEYNNSHKKKRIRELSESYLSWNDTVTGEKHIKLTNVVSMFESTLSRSFEIKTNELTYDIFILEIYYYDIAQDLILNGFNYDGKHYVYFSSSAGQIRTKKAVFVNEEKYDTCKLKLMCGLTVDKINEKGGMNINKFLAYLALANSATDLWEDAIGTQFDIDKAIVVDDFETTFDCKVDYIDYLTYEIYPNQIHPITIPHTDGCGMIDPKICTKNFMVRLPFVKGLLGSFDYKKFIKETGCSPKVKDIWGKEYDIFEDDIQVIFTKSQLKMHKYYDSWEQYKQYFKQYECEACVCNLEEDKIPNAHINYQMLQTLYLASDEEITELCSISNKKIKDITSSLKNALGFYGVSLDDEVQANKDWFQKSLKIYPELILDPSAKADLHDLKNSYINNAKSGKLDVIGKFTFVLPDLYAFCQWLFCGIEIPNGLLANNEVYCRLYPNAKELDCLRSPHLYIEHAVRNNVVDRGGLDEWFCTDAIYASTHDPISRILQFDVDGDRLLVLAQRNIINLAKRCNAGVNPLYYEMKKAKAEIITNKSLYNGLKLAFTGGRIGGISNDVTKIWNCGKEITEDAKKSVKWLCMETNFTIDYAKTLYKPTRPDEVNEIIKSFTRAKTPYFFQFAKGKTYSEDDDDSQVEKINNSMMNRIVNEIKENRSMFRPINGLEKINYKHMLPFDYEEYSNELLNKLFDKWNKKYGNNIVVFDEENTNKNNINVIVREMKDALHKIQPDDNKILISLVKFLYEKPSNRKKKLLWYAYGEDIYNNLLANIDSGKEICPQCGARVDSLTQYCMCPECTKKKKKEEKKLGYKVRQCVDCGLDFMAPLNAERKCRCNRCGKEYRRAYLAAKKRENREKVNNCLDIENTQKA